MQHEGVAALAFECVDDLSIATGTQRYCTNGLSFTTSKQSRSVSLVEDVNFTNDRSNCAAVAPVNSRFATNNALANNILFEGFKLILDIVFRRSTFHSQRRNGRIADLADTLVTCSFFRDSVSFTQSGLGFSFNGGFQTLVNSGCRPLPTRLARLLTSSLIALITVCIS